MGVVVLRVRWWGSRYGARPGGRSLAAGSSPLSPKSTGWRLAAGGRWSAGDLRESWQRCLDGWIAANDNTQQHDKMGFAQARTRGGVEGERMKQQHPVRLAPWLRSAPPSCVISSCRPSVGCESNLREAWVFPWLAAFCRPFIAHSRFPVQQPQRQHLRSLCISSLTGIFTDSRTQPRIPRPSVSASPEVCWAWRYYTFIHSSTFYSISFFSIAKCRIDFQ